MSVDKQVMATLLTRYLEDINPRLTLARALGYDYGCTVRRVVDGDTVDLVVDMGFYSTMTLRFRLLEVNTPERDEARWAEAKLFVEEWLRAHATGLRVTTIKTDKYGRWLAYIYDPLSQDDLSVALLKHEANWRY